MQLNCSIDATGELDRYIRYPSNWNKIVENFETVRQLANVGIEITVQYRCIIYPRLQDLIEWASFHKHKIYSQHIKCDPNI